jgi:quaternary ammonium compound-resistance protein SugE
LLIIAGLLEVSWSLGLRATEGFTNVFHSVWTIAAIILSMILLAKSAQTIPIGTAYPVWVGIGALGAAIGGIILYREPVTAWKIFFLLLLIGSIIGLKLTSTKS